MKQKLSNRSLALSVAALACGMLMLAYASVPLYRLFCQVTGFGGTTMRADAVPGQVLERSLTIRFNADIDKDLPWNFKPSHPSLHVKIGESALTSYRVTNRADAFTTGHATYNVVPEAAGAYFNKVECFCFQNQTLKPNQLADLPVSFFIDPAIAKDPNLKDLTTITLSYTFFAAKNP